MSANKMSAKKLLDDIVSNNGIVRDLYSAEEVLALEEVIGENANAINEASFGTFFGSLQFHLSRALILYVARIFEDNKKYQIRSIPSALKVMRENSTKLAIVQKPSLTRKMVGLGYKEQKLDLMTDWEITELIIKHFEEAISEIKIRKALDSLRTVRNKKVAHCEVVEWKNLDKPTYSQLRVLMELAKEFVSVVGSPYLNVEYGCDHDNYLLSSDAGRASRCMKRMLKKFGVISN